MRYFLNIIYTKLLILNTLFKSYKIIICLFIIINQLILNQFNILYVISKIFGFKMQEIISINIIQSSDKAVHIYIRKLNVSVEVYV